MDENNPQEPTYSRESIATTSITSPSEMPKTTEPAPMERPAPFSTGTLKTRLSGWLEAAWNPQHLSLAEVTAFLKRTRRLWLTVAAVAIGLIGFVTLVQRLAERARNMRERRHEQAVATVTPDQLIARCGVAAEDVTKEVYPILMRTMSYPARGDRKLVVAFSRTAEEKSDWVFLSMNDESGAASYDTPEAKIAALPCLDSKR